MHFLVLCWPLLIAFGLAGGVDGGLVSRTFLSALSANDHSAPPSKIATTVVAPSPADDAECQDGVCSVKKPSSGSSTDKSSSNADETLAGATDLEPSPTTPTNTTEEAAVEEMEKLGWSSEIARKALAVTNYDVTQAATLLEEEEELLVKEDSLARELVAKDWGEGAVRYALRESGYNATVAEEMLIEEENQLFDSFNRSLAELVENGWEEFAARTALRLQFTIQQRRILGYNDTIPTETLAKIRPSLRPSILKLTSNSISPSSPSTPVNSQTNATAGAAKVKSVKEKKAAKKGT